VPAYVAIIAVLASLMWIASQVIGEVAHGRSARLARLALAGHEGDAAHDHVNPPVTCSQMRTCCSRCSRGLSGFVNASR